MTRDEAIKRLDWYFDYDDESESDDKTKEAYWILRNIAIKYEEYEGKRKRLFSDTIICPVCKDSAKWNTALRCYRCNTCGWNNGDKIGW